MKAIGISSFEKSFTWVILDGNPKSYRVLSKGIHPARIAQNNPVNDLEEKNEIGNNNVGGGPEKNIIPVSNHALLALPSRACLLREIQIPFVGREEIRKTLRFEAENSFQSYPIEDLIVDSIILEEGGGGTTLFVAGCPKEIIGETLDGVNKLGVDPENFCLDAELLVQSANKLGILSTDIDEDELLISIDYDQTLLCFSRKGRVESIRSLRFGLDRCVAEIAQKKGVNLGETKEKLFSAIFLESQEKKGVASFKSSSTRSSLPENSEKNFKEKNTFHSKTNDIFSDLDSAIISYSKTLRKEYLRFIAGNTTPLDPKRVFVTGMGAKLPTIESVIHEAIGIPCKRLNFFKLVGEDGFFPEFEMAFAATLGAMAAIPLETNFRQEEYVFKRKFDRLKTPLGMVLLLILIFLLAFDLNLFNGIKRVEEGIGVKVLSGKVGGKKSKQAPRYTGLLYQIAHPNPRRGHVKAYLPNKVSSEILRQVAKTHPTKRVKVLLNQLKSYRKKLESETGYFPELKLESGLSVLVWFSEIIRRANDSKILKSFLVTKVTLKVGTKKTNRYLEIKLVFRGNNFREQAASFMEIINQVIGMEGCPFIDFEEKGGGEPFQGTSEPGATYVFRLNLKGEIPVVQK